MMRLPPTLFMKLKYNKTIFHVRQIRKPSQHILVASFTQSSISHQIDDYLKNLNQIGGKKVKEEKINEENDLDDSENVVIGDNDVKRYLFIHIDFMYFYSFILIINFMYEIKKFIYQIYRS